MSVTLDEMLGRYAVGRDAPAGTAPGHQAFMRFSAWRRGPSLWSSRANALNYEAQVA